MAFRPTLDQLRVIVAVADAGTFSAAARQLGRVQPAITQSIKALEAGTKIPIFDRRGKSVVMTEAGRLMVLRSREALAAVDALCDEALRLSSGLEAELSVAIDSAVPQEVVTASLKTVNAAFPDLKVAVFSEGFGGAEQLLREGLVQLAIYFSSAEASRTGLVRAFLGAFDLVPVVSADHPLASEPGRLTPAILGRHVQLVMSDRARAISPVQGTIVSPRVWLFSEYGARLDCLRAGLGWGHALNILVDDDLASGRLKALRLDDDFKGSELFVYHRLGQPPARAGQLFVDEVRRFLRDYPSAKA